jgi:hypothetical protein
MSKEPSLLHPKEWDQAKKRFPQLSELEEAIKALREAEIRVKQTKAFIQALPGKWSNCPHFTEHDRWEVAGILYFGCPEMNAGSIAESLFGIKTNSLVETLKKSWRRRCIECGKLEAPARTRRAWENPVCPSCEQEQVKRNNEVTRRWMRQTHDRIQSLREMPYKQYLETEHWLCLRDKKLRNSKFRCQLCNASGELNVHHRTYENRGNEPLHDLIVLCRNCHEHFHGITSQNEDKQ